MNDAIIQTDTNFIFFLIKQAALKGKSGLFSHENKYNKLMSKNLLSLVQYPITIQCQLLCLYDL